MKGKRDIIVGDESICGYMICNAKGKWRVKTWKKKYL